MIKTNKNMNCRFIAVLLFYVLKGLNSEAKESQIDYPEIGKPVPEFYIKEVANHNSSEITSKNMDGKFFILDFWSKGCVGCIASFPKLNELHQTFKGQVSIILVGTDEEGIQTMFEKFRKRLDLTFPFAFSDLYKRFVPGGVPHLIWVDNSGIVRAITNSSDLNDENLKAFLAGQPFDFYNTSYLAKKIENDYDFDKPFLVNGNGGKDTDFLHRSLLAQYKPPMPFINFTNFENLRVKGRLEGVAGLYQLYKLAYAGQSWITHGDSIYTEFYNSVVLELSDSSMFVTDNKTGQGIYWYSLIVPPSRASSRHMMEIMQRDLQNYFGFNVKVETRVMPYWKFFAPKKVKDRLKTKGGETTGKADFSGYKGTNIPIHVFFSFLFGLINPYHMPFIDETGIEGNIDVEAEVRNTDLEDIKRCLKELGIQMVKSEKEFRVIVISDPK